MRQTLTWVVIVMAWSGVAACGDDDGGTTPRDSGADTARADTGGGGDTGPGDTGPADTGPRDMGGGDMGGGDGGMPDLVARGDYIVSHVAACGDCHTPFGPMGPDRTRLLAGGNLLADLVPGDDTMGAIYSRNLTPDMETGIGGATDEQIKNAFLNGVMIPHGSGGMPEALFPVMPYQVFHNMSDEDADAVVAYLRSIPAVNNAVPDRQPLPFPFDMPAPPIDEATIPHTTLPATDPMHDVAEQGRYLAGGIGVCMDCHTARDPMTGDYVRDRLFAGGFDFPAAELMLPSPPFPEHIFSRNITPHMNGIMGWTPEQVRAVLLMGVDIDGQGICPPMPAGPMQAFGGLTDEDALAIGVYLTTIPAIASDDYPECVPPMM